MTFCILLCSEQLRNLDLILLSFLVSIICYFCLGIYVIVSKDRFGHFAMLSSVVGKCYENQGQLLVEEKDTIVTNKVHTWW